MMGVPAGDALPASAESEGVGAVTGGKWRASSLPMAGAASHHSPSCSRITCVPASISSLMSTYDEQQNSCSMTTPSSSPKIRRWAAHFGGMGTIAA